MELGVFSLSLKVKDMEKSLDFYQKLGFEVIDGGHMNDQYPDTDKEKWRILSHDSVKIGLFQHVIDSTLLTFHPQDARAVQRTLKASGVELIQEADMDGGGPASIILADPDGNMIMMDQF